MPINSINSNQTKTFLTLISISVFTLFTTGCRPAIFILMHAGPSGPSNSEYRKAQQLRDHQKKTGIEILKSIYSSLPQFSDEWQQINPNNDSIELQGSYYSPSDDYFQLSYDFRKRDGSDNLSCQFTINPPTKGLQWYSNLLLIPHDAIELDFNNKMRAWGNNQFSWNHFLPDYDHKANNPKAYTVQIYIGNWSIRPINSDDIYALQELNRNHLAREIDKYSSIKPADPKLIPASKLSPVLTTKASNTAIPLSRPSVTSKSPYPHCIGIAIAGKNKESVMKFIYSIDFQTIIKITQHNKLID